MILIKEDTPKKLPGITSLFISFDYNKLIIDSLKCCTVFNYDKNSKVWEVPITDLAYLLDTLTYIDDIKLEIKKDKKIKND